MTGQIPESDDTEPRMFHALRRLLQARNNLPEAPATAAPEKPEGWWEEPADDPDPDLGPGWNGSIGR
ncbi:MAG: hypothetical protein NWR47_02610 [Aestuariivirgaceae bacterium]|nr:hypothetical protein [Aestuariivirgaceae bacterium]